MRGSLNVRGSEAELNIILRPPPVVLLMEMVVSHVPGTELYKREAPNPPLPDCKLAAWGVLKVYHLYRSLAVFIIWISETPYDLPTMTFKFPLETIP